MLKTRTHINELETKIALDLVHRYLGIQQVLFVILKVFISDLEKKRNLFSLLMS